MPTYQQRFGQRKPPPHPFHPGRRALPAPATQLEHFKPVHVAGDQRYKPGDPQRAYRAMTQASILERQGRHKEAADVRRAAGVSVNRASITPAQLLRTVTGVDIHRAEHPLRARQHDVAQGNAAVAAYKRGDITLAQAQKQAGMQIGIIPWGPTIGRLTSRLFGGRGAETAAADAAATEALRFTPRPRTQAEAVKRLGILEKRQEAFYRNIGGKYRGIDTREQARRNVVSGAGVQPTLSSQFDEQVFQKGERFLAANPEHPQVKSFLANRAEAEQLRSALSTQHLPGETPPKVDYGIATPREQAANAKALAEKVRLSLPEARRTARLQKAAISEQKGLRVARAEVARQAAGGGMAGHYAALAEQRGAYAKPIFERLRQGTAGKADLDNLARQVDSHPGLDFYAKQDARTALANAIIKGEGPRPFEERLLREIFGQDAVKQITALSAFRGAGNTLVDVAQIPRALMSSVDVSAPFRQGVVMLGLHPGLFFKDMKPMFKALAHESSYQDILKSIHEDANYQLAVDHGLVFTELGPLGVREERFMSNLAEKLNVPVGGGHSVGPGHLVRSSGRAYTGFLDKLRMDSFNSMVEDARALGVNTEDAKFLRDVSKFINKATGRGSLGKLESWGPALNTILFAPRLIASRLNLLTDPINPHWWLTTHPYVRRQEIIAMSRLAAFGGTALGLAALGGATVVLDPRNSDFAKIKIGNTRFDPFGGFQQYITLGARLSTMTVVSSSTGQKTKLGFGRGKTSPGTLLARFARGKTAPPVSFAWDALTGTNYAGQRFQIKPEVLSRLVPLAAQDGYAVYQQTKGQVPFEQAFGLSLALYGVSAFGIGVQSYGKKKPTSKRGPATGGSKVPYAPSGGGSGNPYLPPAHGGNPYLPSSH